jgi:hypothetical protein
MIYQATSPIPFDSIRCSSPKPTLDHAFISLLSISNEEILIQTPKCTSKGVSKVVDFVIPQNQPFLDCIAALEERVQQLIYEKRDVWFMEDTLTMDDIQSSFVSLLKQKGDVYTLRGQVHSIHAPLVFNEAKLPIEETSIKETTPLIGLLHVVGIRFNQRMFQLVVHVKQLLAITSSPKCLIQYEELLDIDDSKN